MSGQSRRFNGPLRKAKELIEAGDVGDLFYGQTCLGSNVRDLATPWWGDPVVGGPSNLLYNWGSHLLDHIYYLYGPPVRVFAEGSFLGGPPWGRVLPLFDDEEQGKLGISHPVLRDFRAFFLPCAVPESLQGESP